MKIIVFGANGKTGKIVVEEALKKEYEVTIFVRNASRLNINHSNLTTVIGDALDFAAVSEAIKGHDAVISCLGSSTGLGKSTSLRSMSRNIVEAMNTQHVERIIYMASAGIENELEGMMGKMTMFLLRNVLEDHREAVNFIKNSDLKWTIARPMGLTDKPFNGTYREQFNGVPKGSNTISRAAVADFIIRSLTEEKYWYKSVALVN